MNIMDDSVLRRMAGKAGLDEERAMAALYNPQLVSSCEEEIKEAVTKGRLYRKIHFLTD